MNILKGLSPKRVFYFFEKICAIPHGSGNTKAISDFCVSFAKENGLECYQDQLNNIIIKKPASLDYEEKEPVILQGHLDMVCEKDADIDFDFTKDGLNLKVDGDLISANGTTLGADDGIAIAMSLAILEDKSLKHPPVEALFTVDEETGMYGAEGIDTSLLKGKMLINIDSGNQDVLTVSCAGGARADISLPLKKEAISAPIKKITVLGLLGGHSGTEINAGRINANVLMGKFLGLFDDIKLIKLEGGKKDNVIPFYCEAVVSTKEDIESKVQKFVEQNVVDTDPNLKIKVEAVDGTSHKFCYSNKSSKMGIALISALPNGIIKMSSEIKGLVQTSLNLGVMKLFKDSLTLSFALRSSINEDKLELIKELEKIALTFKAECTSHSHYSAWEYKKDSFLRKTLVTTYKELFGKEPIIEAVHAGLECGLFSEKIKGLDAVSIGPNMYDIHSSKERLSVSSVEKSFNFLVKTLENL